MSFCGSYRPEDVTFLLKRLAPLPLLDVAQKERLIQSGARHYSEMLSPEALPSPRYLEIFQQACAANRPQMARDCLTLAALIAARRSGPITLVSLVRAGTPVGVILKHLLQQVMGRGATAADEVTHYSVSIVRDRGIDEVALQHILHQGHAPESIVFIDGWTGKGVISRVLEQAVGDFNQRHRLAIDAGLYVLSDLAGTAACAASSADYLIPSSILNATVSGLVSRSVLNASIGAGDFHGCVYYEEFAAHDQSRAFADSLIAEGVAQAARHSLPAPVPVDRAKVAAISTAFLNATMARHGITDVNLIKPGIGEATRVLLRRVPRLLVLREPEAPDVAHLKLLAAEKSVPCIVDARLPYQAVSLIQSALDG